MKNSKVEMLEVMITTLRDRIKNIENALNNGIPRCPLCGSVLFEHYNIWKCSDGLYHFNCIGAGISIIQTISICEKCAQLDDKQLMALLECKFGKGKK